MIIIITIIIIIIIIMIIKIIIIIIIITIIIIIIIIISCNNSPLRYRSANRLFASDINDGSSVQYRDDEYAMLYRVGTDPIIWSEILVLSGIKPVPNPIVQVQSTMFIPCDPPSGTL